MDKVKLPKQVAESIEKLRSHDFEVTNHDIIYAFAASKSNEYPALVEFASNDRNFDTLLKALVNGYEVEQTPEDKVREFYQDRLNAEDHSQVNGILFTLNAFGKKIEGVNS